MHVKLGIIFSIITLALTLAYSIFFYIYEQETFHNRAKEGLTTLGERMISQFDDYVQIMDYTLENLISNAQFMDAMAFQANLNNRQHRNEWLEASNVMSNVLYRDALNKNYYRVNVFNRNGMFFTSRFDNRDTVNPLSYDLSQLIGSIEWLLTIEQSPFQRFLVAPHRDPWTTGQGVNVFSAVRSIVWMGQPIGYLEVQGREEELRSLFSPQGLEGVSVSAFINDGQLLFESEDGAAARGRAFLTEGAEPGNTGLYEVSFTSEKNPVTIYMSQNTEAWQASLLRFMYQIGITALILLSVTLLIIFLVSRRLTHSIRQLEKEISNVHFADLTLSPKQIGLRAGDEIFRLENAFHALTERLNTSIQDEMRSRELHLKARMNTLQAQINPHFIYNTLNVINSKSLEHGVFEIAHLTDRFSDMLRYTNNMETKTVTLEQELQHVANYLALMKSRYEHKLNYKIDLPEDMLQMKLPRLTLQPLVENAILHGYKCNGRIMRIKITGRLLSDQFMLEIRDNGDGFNEETLRDMSEFAQRVYDDDLQEAESKKSGVGLINTLSRLYYFSNGTMTFSLFNESGAVIRIYFAKQ